MTDEPTNPQPDRIGNEEIKELFAKLDELRETLPPGQKALLDGILRVAVNIRDDVAVDDRPFSEQFVSAFTITPAERVLAFAHGVGVVNPHTDAIHRALQPFSFSPAAIHR